MTCKVCGTGKEGLIACACMGCHWEAPPHRKESGIITRLRQTMLGSQHYPIPINPTGEEAAKLIESLYIQLDEANDRANRNRMREEQKWQAIAKDLQDKLNAATSLNMWLDVITKAIDEGDTDKVNWAVKTARKERGGYND